jgi:hypothetical protein
MANEQSKSKFPGKRARADAHLSRQATFRAGFSQNLLVTAHEPLDLGADEALHHGRQIGVKPSFEHRAQHFAGKFDDRIAASNV